MTYDGFDRVEVRVHPYFMWEYLSSVTLSVLPCRFGAHSGWIEACFDLGTAVIAPSCGFYHQHRPCGAFDFTEHSFDPASLQQAVSHVYQRWARNAAAPRANSGSRRAERVRIAQAHRAVYEGVLR